jgi:2-polyprenyl-3-methyl-5-hydroxy-6-metoxy-1,4-benzoquinol methylase
MRVYVNNKLALHHESPCAPIGALPDTVASTLTGRPAKLVKKLPTARIVELLAQKFGYDAGDDFRGVDQIGLYKDDSGFRFWWPIVDGPEALYRVLEGYDFNYQEGKWEHLLALKHVRPSDRVLDVGCGEGAFLNQARKITPTVTGLELNRSAAAKAAAKGIEMREELIAAHAVQRPEHYDVVTSFQVLEHVKDPNAFVQGLVDALRPRGTLIIGVPNCDTFLALDDGNVLNQPPHHIGWWNRQSLEALAALFPITPISIDAASLADERHIMSWFNAVARERCLPQSRVLGSLYYRLGIAKRVEAFFSDIAKSVGGHTMLAVYRKAG